MKTDILSLTPEELQDEITVTGGQKFRAEQIFNWLHVKKTTNFSEMSNLSEQFRQKLTAYFCIKPLIIRKKLVSEYDYTVKYLYGLNDGENIETVLMKYRHGASLCISTQAGCKMNCAFCASGAYGFKRNLKPSEMLGQLYETERDSGIDVKSIVLMGIGEPLDNFGNTVKFLRLLSDKSGRNMSLRHVSLSTCGLSDRIDELAKLKLGLTLSVSLHAADDKTRSRLMPVNDVFNIDRLMASCRNYFKETGRRISFEYALIKGLNDSFEAADRLVKLIKPLGAHVNLITVNPTLKNTHHASGNAKVFYERLTSSGINATIRRTLGADINAACGQLRGQEN
ncbi:MAG: 23S rRNA (adenine(2503)-C(2))-methyltransferase RlmN [Oscillospiraceae bacterium]|jgi:23S rRNA (adenine2503-C2)-methyltransferase|nr:23S rRNA (adenine(2503)-C(2))-methyltransferase RlmN [Oscillospiraceae bacterium]